MELLKQEKTAKSTVTLTVKVSKEEFEQANTKAFAQNSKKLNIPGFRKGKAPRQMIEKMYGKEIFFDEAINICYPSAFELAMKESKVAPIARPTADVSEMNEEGVTFTIVVPVYPEMSLKSYKGIEAVKEEIIVADDEAVNLELAEVSKKLSRIETVDRAVENGDIVNFDFEGFIDGVAFPGGKADGFDLEIGSGQFIPGFEEQIISQTIDNDFEVKVAFPETYHSEDLAGKEAVFKCKINLVKQSICPELDDEFAKDASDFDTLAEYKKDIADKITEKNKTAVENRFEENIMAGLVENLEGEIPDAMMEQQLDRIVEDFSYRIQMQGVSIDDYLKMNSMEMSAFRNLFSIQAEQQLKTKLALEVVAAKENLTVTDEELNSEFENMAKTYNMEIDKVKTAVPVEALKSDLLLNKSAAFVRENAVATKKS